MNCVTHDEIQEKKLKILLCGVYLIVPHTFTRQLALYLWHHISCYVVTCASCVAKYLKKIALIRFCVCCLCVCKNLSRKYPRANVYFIMKILTSTCLFYVTSFDDAHTQKKSVTQVRDDIVSFGHSNMLFYMYVSFYLSFTVFFYLSVVK